MHYHKKEEKLFSINMLEQSLTEYKDAPFPERKCFIFSINPTKLETGLPDKNSSSSFGTQLENDENTYKITVKYPSPSRDTNSNQGEKKGGTIT